MIELASAELSLLLGSTTQDLLFWGIRAALLIGGLILLAVIVAMLNVGAIWFQALSSGARIPIIELIAMKIRKVSPARIVKAKIMAQQAGLQSRGKNGIDTPDLEAHYLAGGNIEKVILAIIAAKRAEIDLDFDRAAAIDLAGRDVLEAVKTSVYPLVIDCPDGRYADKTTLSAISKDGIELRVRARVTVRTNLDQLIGGATEETIIARVGEGIITSIGSTNNLSSK